MTGDASSLFAAWQGLVDAHLGAWQTAFDRALRDPRAAVPAFEEAAATTASLLQEASTAAWGPASASAASAQVSDVRELAVQIDAIRERIAVLEEALTALVPAASASKTPKSAKVPGTGTEGSRSSNGKKRARDPERRKGKKDRRRPDS